MLSKTDQPAFQVSQTSAPRRRKIVVPLTIAFLATMLPATMSARQHLAPSLTESAPALQLDRYAVDLGDIFSEATHEVTFRIVNRGDQRLVVNEIDLGCCGAPVRKTLIISPGDAEDWIARINPAFKRGAIEQRAV